MIIKISNFQKHLVKLANSFLIMLVISLLVSCAGIRKETPEDWVEQKLNTMSLEQKVGQLMLVRLIPQFYNVDDPQLQLLMNKVKSGRVGSLTIAPGEPYALARMLDKLQQAADVPLIVMADMEWGASMRVNESTDFPPNMAIGATRSENYAYQVGKFTAKEARAIGIHVNYAPVMDVNNNPDNIIINTRAFGEDPDLVAKLGTAYLRGLQENGVYATAKHFPGHGDTDVDSHLGLPTIQASKNRLDSVELAPFRAAVNAGVKLVMIAHITYSDFPQMEGRPATLDPYFIETVLKKNMGFEGLVITDAMGMGGIVNNYWSGEAAVMAINAGADILLNPPNFDTTFNFVVEAVREGRISRDRLNDAVRKVLQTKKELGLTKKPEIDLVHLEEIMANPQHLRLSQQISDSSITLVRDDYKVLPLKADKLDSVLALTITDREWGYIYERRLKSELNRRIPIVRSGLIDTRSTFNHIQEITAKADSSQAIIVGMFMTWGSFKGSITFPDSTAKLIKEFFQIEKPMAVISFGSPYLLRQVPETPSYICAYQTTPSTVRAAMRAVFGENYVNAKLPVSIPPHIEYGAGMTQTKYKMRIQERIDDDFMRNAYNVLEEAIADSIFPGAQVAVLHNDTLLANRGIGHMTYDVDSPEITPETIYDLASITKTAATTLVAMKLYEQRRIRLDIPVKSYLPEFSGGMKDSVTVRHLLTHSAGLKGWVPLWNKAKDKTEALNYIYQLPLRYTPGDSMVYSDLGLITMQQIIRTVTGESLDKLVNKEFYEPLDMKNSMFNPPENVSENIAPTEVGGDLDRGLIQGEVHDENAYFLGGVAGHAGLFSTAKDLAIMSQMLLNGGIYRHKRFLQPKTIRQWTTRQEIPRQSERALGWDTPSDEGSSAGDYFSPGSFGHLGFTGTSIWIDPNREIAIILLTNRVHPTRERGGIYQVRRKFHNEAMKALLKRIGEELPEMEEETTH